MHKVGHETYLGRLTRRERPLQRQQPVRCCAAQHAQHVAQHALRDQPAPARRRRPGARGIAAVMAALKRRRCGKVWAAEQPLKGLQQAGKAGASELRRRPAQGVAAS